MGETRVPSPARRQDIPATVPMTLLRGWRSDRLPRGSCSTTAPTTAIVVNAVTLAVLMPDWVANTAPMLVAADWTKEHMKSPTTAAGINR